MYRINIIFVLLLCCNNCLAAIKSPNFYRCVEKVDEYFLNLQKAECKFRQGDGEKYMSGGDLVIDRTVAIPELRWHYVVPFELNIDMKGYQVTTYSRDSEDIRTSEEKNIMSEILWRGSISDVKYVDIKGCHDEVGKGLSVYLTKSTATGMFIELRFGYKKDNLLLKDVDIGHPFNRDEIISVQLYGCKFSSR